MLILVYVLSNFHDFLKKRKRDDTSNGVIEFLTPPIGWQELATLNRCWLKFFDGRFFSFLLFTCKRLYVGASYAISQITNDIR